jgi:aspartyl-tRNA(Asn)/glutamyl-tRNA(Gln) amidotransferase subunit B
MPALANEIRERLALHGLSQQDIDVLMAVDSGNEVGLDGRLNHGAVTYFEVLTKGRSSKMVVNWCVVVYGISRTRQLTLLYDSNLTVKDNT